MGHYLLDIQYIELEKVKKKENHILTVRTAAVPYSGADGQSICLLLHCKGNPLKEHYVQEILTHFI